MVVWESHANVSREVAGLQEVWGGNDITRVIKHDSNLNSQTMKNNYLLLLITELINNMGRKKVFTKMDLRWGFNNVRIKEGDEWKRVFTTHIGSFKPTVMFFRIMNLLATFQAMINEILRDLINKGKTAVFVDDVLVGMETEERHNEIVKEILRRLKENDLYIKPEKCVWKVRKIRFLGVIIGPNRIEKKKKKVDRILSWPEPKNVKDVMRPKIYSGLKLNKFCNFTPQNRTKIELPAR